MTRAPSNEGDPRASELRALARRWIEQGWQRGRSDIVDELHDSSFVDHDPGGRPATTAGFKQGIERLYAAFPDFHAIVEELVIEPARGAVTVRWSALGTHRGSYLGAAPTNRKIAFKGIEILHVRDGRIVERWGEWDGLELLGQLGVWP